MTMLLSLGRILSLAILLCQDAFTDREVEQAVCNARINSKFSHHVTYDTLALRLRAAKFVCPDNKVCQELHPACPDALKYRNTGTIPLDTEAK